MTEETKVGLLSVWVVFLFIGSNYLLCQTDPEQFWRFWHVCTLGMI